MIRALAFVWLYTVVAAVSPQTLTPVTAQANGGIPWWAGPLVGVIIVGIGFAYLKFKKPAIAAQVQTTVSTDAAALGKLLAEALSHAKAANEAPAIAATVPDLQPELDKANAKLTQIKAILDA